MRADLRVPKLLRSQPDKVNRQESALIIAKVLQDSSDRVRRNLRKRLARVPDACVLLS